MANGNLKASEIGLGCMRIANLEKNTVNNLINTVENLDRKYLLPEVIEEPRFQEARIINDVLKQCNKSMHEKVKHYKDEQIEYREYIENSNCIS